MNARTMVAGVTLAVLPAVQAMADEHPWRNQDQAILIPPAAMQELLRCRHQGRPEDECFDRMVRAIDNEYRTAEGFGKPTL